jgi:hypothetical protein
MATLNSPRFLVGLCDVFQLEKPWYNRYFVCVMSKVYKYAKNESKQFVKTLRKFILKIIMPFKRPSHGLKNWAKGSTNKKLHELKLVCCHKNLKPLRKPSLPQKLCFCQETLCHKC